MSDKIDDGGPAFPLNVVAPHGDFANNVRLPGMSLRDWFAGMVLNGLMSSGARLNGKTDISTDDYVQAAWIAADAMLKAREARP